MQCDRNGGSGPAPDPSIGDRHEAASPEARGSDLLLVRATTLAVLLSIRLTIGAPASEPSVILLLLALQAAVPLAAWRASSNRMTDAALAGAPRSEEHTSEPQSRAKLVRRRLLQKNRRSS